MKIYCDASFNNRHKVAGIGIVICNNQKERHLSFWIPAKNNNYAELWACYIGAILSGGQKADIYSDSQTALDYINGYRGREYYEKHKREWTREQYFEYKRMSLLAYKIRKVSDNISFVKIKAHQKYYQTHQIGNSQADLAAKKGIAKFFEKNR